MQRRALTPSRRALACAGLLSWVVFGGLAQAAFVTGTFEDQNPGSNTFKNNFQPATTFGTGGFTLNNSFDNTFGTWSGFSTSSKIDNVFGGQDYLHQYGAYAPTVAGGTGSGGSATYAVAYNGAQGDAVINLPNGASPYSIDLANTTYTAQSVSLGDQFARAFHQGDFFRLDILGYAGLNGTGAQVGDIPYYLADFRGNSLVLLSNWTTVDLTPLAGAKSLAFNLTTTDVGQFGPNTPLTFAVDNLVGVTPVPEPSTGMLSVVGFGILGAIARHRAKTGAGR